MSNIHSPLFKLWYFDRVVNKKYVWSVDRQVSKIKNGENEIFILYTETNFNPIFSKINRV